MRRLYVAVAALALAACGDKGPTNPPDVMFDVTGRWSVQGVASAQHPWCGFSGTLTLTGSSGDFQGTGTVNINGIATGESAFLSGGYDLLAMDAGGGNAFFLNVESSNSSRFVGSYTCESVKAQWSMNRQ